MYGVPITLLEALSGYFAHSEQFMFFDTARPSDDDRYSYLFTHPVARLQCRFADPVEPFLAEVQQWLKRGYHVAGWFGYEFSALLDPDSVGLIRRPEQAAVVADLGVFGQPHVFDHVSGVHDFPVVAGGGHLGEGPSEYTVEELRLNTSEEEYLAALDTILGYIAAGDTYQVNYTLKLLFTLGGSIESFYRALRRNQSVPYGAYIRWGQQRVLSFSPELFFRKNEQGILVKPMKGTLRRGLDLGEDGLAAGFLQADRKNQSENVMIVDLLRNDLGRVLFEAGGGEVRVRSLFDVETYESLLQMTSSIQATSTSADLAAIPLVALFRALFPCGSVTGAPKIRTMQIIAEQEKDCRGVYTGAIGFLSPMGDAVFNVPIRTVVLAGNRGEMGIGSGITHDSDPRDEWQECLLKGRFLAEPVPEFHLIETILWCREGGYWLLAGHLARLRQSAQYFYFGCDVEKLTRLLFEACQEWAGQSCRVRVLLAKDGEFTIQGQPCPPPGSRQLPPIPAALTGDEPILGFSPERTWSGDVWLRHKSTNRGLYNREFARATGLGWADLLFQNEKGEVTEGCISNLVIWYRGEYLTPPIAAGILPGVLRASLLAGKEPVVREKSISFAEVREAAALFLVNSVRGVVRVRLAECDYSAMGKKLE